MTPPHVVVKDPTGGDPDRIQLTKGWLDTQGKPQEQIYDVVWGDAAYFEVKMSTDVPMTTQERAWTSPIRYAPAAS